MGAVWGSRIRLTIFGESHSAAIGGVLSGLPAGMPFDAQKVARQMARRAPGGANSTQRKEADEVKILSGVKNGCTTGAPLGFEIANSDTRSGDYSAFSVTPRPSHSDYPAGVKYGGHNDFAGGGHCGRAFGRDQYLYMLQQPVAFFTSRKPWKKGKSWGIYADYRVILRFS